MARGDRREPIVSDDTDYNLLLETLGEMCQRTGCVVHAYVILPHHYHLALETPGPKLAGLPAVKELGLSLQNCISRGWYFGSQIFGEQLLKMSGADLAEKPAKRADGYYGVQLQDHGELRARGILSAGLKVFGLTESVLLGLCNTDYRKLLSAEVIRSETVLGLDWIRSALNMGDRSYCSHLIQRQKHCLKNSPKLRAMREKLLDITRILD